MGEIYYSMIRHFNSTEAFGIFKTELSRPATNKIIGGLDKAIGHYRWWLDTISKTEFETYKEFGFKEYSID